MPPEVRDAALLHDMLNAARRAVGYAAGRSRADMDANPMFADAVIRRIEIVGEAARGVSQPFRDAHPEIPWRAITTTRHILAHDYDEVNHDIVWRIIEEHLPPLIAQIVPLLAEAPPPPANP
jgi:uncharacterized protein with HEPN domain